MLCCSGPSNAIVRRTPFDFPSWELTGGCTSTANHCLTLPRPPISSTTAACLAQRYLFLTPPHPLSRKSHHRSSSSSIYQLRATVCTSCPALKGGLASPQYAVPPFRRSHAFYRLCLAQSLRTLGSANAYKSRIWTLQLKRRSILAEILRNS